MQGMINRAVQSFLRDTYGGAMWQRVVAEGPLPVDGFEPMLPYDPVLTDVAIDTAARILARPRETLLEDMGNYLVTHPHLAALRRLLRFGGTTFPDFLNALEDMPDRARLALPRLTLPDLVLTDRGDQLHELACRFDLKGVGHVLLGLLRAMADDYGALVFMEHEGVQNGAEVLSIRLLDATHAEARHFDLAAPVG